MKLTGLEGGEVYDDTMSLLPLTLIISQFDLK